MHARWLGHSESIIHSGFGAEISCDYIKNHAIETEYAEIYLLDVKEEI